MIIRNAERSDNQRLIDLEEEMSMGEKTRITLIKNDFFYKDKYFPSEHILCEDNSDIALIVSIGEKHFKYNGKDLKGALIHNLRINNKFQKKPVREFNQVYLNTLRIFKEKRFDFIYGIIKSDNKDAVTFAERRDYRLLGDFNILIFPNYFKKDPVIKEMDICQINDTLHNYFLPKINSFYSYKSVIFNELDLSQHIKILVKNAPKVLFELTKLIYGSRIIERFEAKKRMLGYKLLQIIKAESKKEIKDLILHKRWDNFQKGIEITAVINRTDIKLFNPISYKNSFYIKTIDPDLEPVLSNTIIDLCDL